MATPSPKRRSSPRHPCRRCSSMNWTWTVSAPRRVRDASITSSWMSANVCRSSSPALTSRRTRSSGSPPAPTKAQWQNAGRRRFPPESTRSARACNGAVRSASTAVQRSSSRSRSVRIRPSTVDAIAARLGGGSTTPCVRCAGDPGIRRGEVVTKGSDATVTRRLAIGSTQRSGGYQRFATVGLRRRLRPTGSRRTSCSPSQLPIRNVTKPPSASSE